MDFDEPICPVSISLTFQGGFVGKVCQLLGVSEQSTDEKEYVSVTTFWPEDVNTKQTFSLPCDDSQQKWKRLKLVFEESTDFYGRVTLYDLSFT